MNGINFHICTSQIPGSKLQIPSGVIEHILGLQFWVLGLEAFFQCVILSSLKYKKHIQQIR